MRVAIDGSHGAIPGGIRSYLENLLPALIAAEPGLDLRVLLRGRTARRGGALPAGATAVPVRWPRRLLDALERHLDWPTVERSCGPVDVVHGTHFSLPRARRGVPTVLTVHDVAYLRRPELYGDRRANDYGYRTLLGASLRRADRVIALAHYSKADLVDLCGVEPERVWVVPHGVDPRFRPASPAAQLRARRRVGIEGAFAIYPVGTITPRKNIDATLESFARAFPDDRARPMLLLTGPGELPAAVHALSERLGIAAAVRAASVEVPGELAALLSAARFGLYPSLYEGFGLPPLEAMACGLPMLVSDRTSCPEVVGEAALLADPADTAALAEAMRRLDGDETLRDELRRRGERRVSDAAFSWLRAARQTLAVYRGDRIAFAAEPDPLRRPASPAAVEPVRHAIESELAR